MANKNIEIDWWKESGKFMVKWDELILVLRRKFPATTAVGGDGGGDIDAIMRVLSDVEERERIMDEIACIRDKFDIQTRAHYDAIAAAWKTREAATRALLASIKTYGRA